MDANQGMCVRELQHPLLLERHLTPLPKKAAIGEEEQVSAFGANDASEDDSAHSQRHVNRRDVRDVVVPIDFNVDSSIKCVAITGPNTGGKTASLKAIGVACLMARAGLYLPCEIRLRDSILSSRHRRFRRFANPRARRRLVHLRRAPQRSATHFGRRDRRHIGLAGRARERHRPGGGRVSRRRRPEQTLTHSRLTIATSHYEEVKEATLASDTAQVAAVEFDLQSLQPTYRLLWGETGKSNALHIAAGLGLEP